MKGSGSGRRERGMTLPLVALFIVVLFAFAALAIDLGVLYTARTSAQHAADAGALAGAFVFGNSPNPAVTTVANSAVSTAVQNKILGQSLTAADFGAPTTASPCPATSASTGVCVDSPNRRVTVYIARSGATAIGTFFARAIGWNSVGVTTRATAEASKQAGGTHCLKPFFIANTVLATDLTAGCGVAPGSPNPPTYPEAIFNPNVTDPSTGAPLMTNYALQRLGTQLQLRPVTPQNWNKSGSPASQYFSLDFGSGADTYSCTIGRCLNDPACGVDTTILQNFTGKCGNSLPVETGMMKQKTYTGIGDLIGATPDVWSPDNPAPLVPVNPSPDFQYCYQGDCSQLRDTSQSLITAPIFDNCQWNLDPGKQTIPLVGFAEFFVDNVPDQQGNITAHFVNASSCGSAQGAGPGVGAGPTAIPIRLIQGP
jgi:Flp pilus assembly protein TadG